jgi:hypothetical protein
MLGGPQGRAGREWKISPPPVLDSRTVKPVMCMWWWITVTLGCGRRPVQRTNMNVKHAVTGRCVNQIPPWSVADTRLFHDYNKYNRTINGKTIRCIFVGWETEEIRTQFSCEKSVPWDDFKWIRGKTRYENEMPVELLYCCVLLQQSSSCRYKRK